MVWDINATNVDQKDKIDCNMGVFSVFNMSGYFVKYPCTVHCKIKHTFYLYMYVKKHNGKVKNSVTLLFLE
jgi:hypothetical protein